MRRSIPGNKHSILLGIWKHIWDRLLSVLSGYCNSYWRPWQIVNLERVLDTASLPHLGLPEAFYTSESSAISCTLYIQYSTLWPSPPRLFPPHTPYIPPTCVCHRTNLPVAPCTCTGQRTHDTLCTILPELYRIDTVKLHCSLVIPLPSPTTVVAMGHYTSIRQISWT